MGRLRNKSHDLHRRVESALGIGRNCDNLAAYRGFLARALGYYESAELMLARFAWQVAGLEFAPRRKVPLVLADLHALGLDVAAVQQLGRCNALPEPESIAGAFGVMYVPEGATLGGQLILRVVQARLGLSVTQGAASHHRYGLTNVSRWRAFRACADRELADPAHCDEAVHMARRTFETYEAWLTDERAPARTLADELERSPA